MLYWICPECGHECSPAIRECPTCTAAPAPKVETNPETKIQAATIELDETVEIPAGIAENLRSLARNFEPAAAPSVGLLAAGPRAAALLTPGPQSRSLASPQEAAIAEAEPEIAAEPTYPELSQTLAALDHPVFRPALPVEPRPVDLSAAPIAIHPGFPALAGVALSTITESTIQPAGLVSGGRVDFEAGRISDPAAVPTAPVSNGNGPWLAPSELGGAIQSLAELLRADRVAAEEQEGISAIEASFRAEPGVRLLPPAEIAIAPAPPTDQWMRSEKPKFTPISPEYIGRTNVMAGPQAPPLPGPTLPPRFVKLDQPGSQPRLKHKRFLSWPTTLLAGTVLILAAASLLRQMMDDHDAKPPAAAAPARAAAPTPAVFVPPAPLIEEHPAARSVEVAGIRIITGPNRRPQLEYLVINHSATELTGLNIRIAVHSEAPGSPPLFRVSGIVQALGPNQAKEMRTELDPSIKPSAFQDWRSLRTEIQIARQ